MLVRPIAATFSVLLGRQSVAVAVLLRLLPCNKSSTPLQIPSLPSAALLLRPCVSPSHIASQTDLLNYSCQDAYDSANAQGRREELEEHYEAGQREQDVQEGRQIPRLPRAYCPLPVRRHRIGRLPDRSVNLDGALKREKGLPD